MSQPDALETYSDFQAITATAASTNVVQKKAGALGLGAGEKTLYAVAQIVENFNLLTNIAIAYQTSAAEAFGSPTTLKTETVLLAAAIRGYYFVYALEAGKVLEFTRFNYTVTGTAPTTGKISAFLIDHVDQFNYLVG